VFGTNEYGVSYRIRSGEQLLAKQFRDDANSPGAIKITFIELTASPDLELDR